MFEGLVESYGTFGLFISAFISSTIAPGGSEAVLLYLLSNNPENSLNLVLVATCGNTLGALTTYYLGYIASLTESSKKINQKYFDKAHNAINRYGSVSLLFSWLPLIGDVLCLAAGWMKLNLLTSLIFITLGKFARYYLLSLTIS
jgi:membrane protein YqaA with SNARE-associated domain